jgi:glycosyltransferase involved in cell wall biosynthesis
MKIGINLTRINGENISGIGIYSIVIAKLICESNKDTLVFLNRSSLKFFSGYGKNIVIVPEIKNKLIYLLWLQIFFPILLLRHKIDILFNPAFYTLWLSPAKQFTTVHDCAILKYPEYLNKLSSIYFYFNYYITRSRADRVIADSNFIKDELIREFKFPKDKISVIYPALPKSTAINNMPELGFSPQVNIGMPYFVFIGNSRPRKNLVGLLEAFSIFNEDNPGYILVLIGLKDGRFIDLESAVKRLGIADNIVRLGYVSDMDKVNVLSKAEALLFPSLYEGFGFPVLEAQSLGVPVITSNMSSLPEVSGEGALFVNPFEPRDIARGMGALIKDCELRRRLIKAGYVNLNRFSWENTVMEILKLMEEANNENT